MFARALAVSLVAGCLAAACGKTSSDGGGGGNTEAGSDSAAAAAGVSGDSGGADVVGEAGAGGDSQGGAADAADGGAAGEGGSVGEVLTGGAIVVATTVAGATPAKDRPFVVLIDPLDGHELARTDTTLDVLGVAYEAARDKWFVFTGTPGQGGVGPLLVGTMRSTGFAVEQTVMVPTPTNQNTIAVLNRRILYRTQTHAGLSEVDDTLALLDTSAAVRAIGKLIIPIKYSLVSAVGAPATGDSAGGRVFFLHDNLDDTGDNCVPPSVGTEQACTVYSSSLPVAATDTNLALPNTAISPVAQIDHDGSDAALGIQPSGNTVVVVAPPRRAVSTSGSAYRYDATTGAAVGAPISFSLETATKKIDPSNSITLPAVAVDPCEDRLFTGELANTALLYAVPFAAGGTVTAFDAASANGIFGALVYEPYTKTIVNFNSDPVSPTFSGFRVAGTELVPEFGVRGRAGAAPWRPPAGLVPQIVVVKNPVIPPCN